MRKILLAYILSITFLLFFAAQAQADVMGIDVSRWQGAIDWETVKNHTDFAIIKAGGSEKEKGLYADEQFARNRDEVRRLDIPRGYYYYAGGTNPVEEAQHFVSLTGALQPGEVLVLDIETDTPDIVGFSFGFLEETEHLTGVKPLLYTNMNRVWGNDWRPVAENGNQLWGAIYDKNPEVFPDPGAWPRVTIKQFTNQGTIPGIDGHAVDWNVISGDITAFKELGKPEENLEAEQEPEAEPGEQPDEQSGPKSGYMGGLGDGRRNSIELLPEEESATGVSESQRQPDEATPEAVTGKNSDTEESATSYDLGKPESAVGSNLAGLLARLLFKR